MRYLPRTLETVVRRAAREFPVVVVTGPRQAGKTTLLRRVFGRTHGYVSLEPPDVREAASVDPRGFLESQRTRAVLDEVQYAPGLLPYIKERVDARRDRAGQYVLTGSQNLLMMESVTESLAGRAGILRLLPLSLREITAEPSARPVWERRRPRPPRLAFGALWEVLVRGGYPELHADPSRDAALWHASYAQTYLERDVRTVRQVGDLVQFQAFLRALAARSAQLLNLADLGRDLGLALNTVKAWLSVLEATHQVQVVRPYHASIGKRLVKTPKVYFLDTGTLCHLVGLRDVAHAMAGPMAGAILETAVLGEIVRAQVHRGLEPQVYFWRTSVGAEVDFLVESAGRLVPIEVKRSATPRRSMADGIRSLRRDLGERIASGYVIHPGDVRLPLGDDVTALPLASL